MAHHVTLPLEFWFDFGSNYSYISVQRIEQLAAPHGVHILWRPFLLGAIFQSLGWATSPFVLQQAKGSYVWRDMARECRKAGVPWQQPSEFPRSAMLAHRVAIAAADQPWIGEFCRQVMVRNFVADQEIASPEAVVHILDRLGLAGQDWIDRALTDANKRRLREQTERARATGIFGAPTFLVGSELFWGNDRLEDAVAWAAGELPGR